MEGATKHTISRQVPSRLSKELPPGIQHLIWHQVRQTVWKRSQKVTRTRPEPKIACVASANCRQVSRGAQESFIGFLMDGRSATLPQPPPQGFGSMPIRLLTAYCIRFFLP